MIGGIRIGAVAALVVLAGLLIGACGSSTSTSTSAKSPSPSPKQEAKISNVDACSLVMASEASTAAGSTVVNLAGSSGAQIPGACIYQSSDGSASVVIFAQVYPDTTAANGVSPEQIAAALNGAYGVNNAKTVSGIGDKAVEYGLTGAQGNGTVIFVFKSNVVLMIAVIPSATSTAIEDLARTAVGRLK